MIPVAQAEAMLRCVSRAATTLPQTTSTTIFTVTDTIELMAIVGEVTVAIAGPANASFLEFDPSAGVLGVTPLCTALDITGDAIGQIYTLNGNLVNPLQDGATGIDNGMHAFGAGSIILTAGVIKFNCPANNTGEVKWCLRYIPIAPSAKVTAT